MSAQSAPSQGSQSVTRVGSWCFGAPPSLLRYEGFEPRAQGIRALLPHIDDFRPVHNLESLDQLAAALAHT